MIYCVAPEQGGLIKIGHSKRPGLRVDQLSHSNRIAMALLGVIDGNTLAESRIHRRFEAYHVGAEWFLPCSPLRRFVAEECRAWQPSDDAPYRYEYRRIRESRAAITSEPCDAGVSYRDVSGFAGYRIGDDGSAWSCLRSHRGCSGLPTFLAPVWRRLKPGVRESGHLHVSLSRVGVKSVKLVHRLVLEAFVGPCPSGMQACHNDGNPANNRLDNLRWDTQAANFADKKLHGTGGGICRTGPPRVNPLIALKIVALSDAGWTRMQIAAHFRLCAASVGNVRRRYKAGSPT